MISVAQTGFEAISKASFPPVEIHFPSSQSSQTEIFTNAVSQLVHLLLTDAELRLLFPTAISKVGPDRFQRNFSRFLKNYSQRLEREALNELQRQAAHFVHISARRTAVEMGRELTQGGSESLEVQKLESELPKAAQVNAWLSHPEQRSHHWHKYHGVNRR